MVKKIIFILLTLNKVNRNIEIGRIRYGDILVYQLLIIFMRGNFKCSAVNINQINHSICHESTFAHHNNHFKQKSVCKHDRFYIKHRSFGKKHIFFCKHQYVALL